MFIDSVYKLLKPFPQLKWHISNRIETSDILIIQTEQPALYVVLYMYRSMHNIIIWLNIQLLNNIQKEKP